MPELDELIRLWKDVSFHLKTWLPPFLIYHIQQTVYYLELYRKSEKGG